MANVFFSAIELMRSMGVFDFFVPFILVFTIIYGVLEKTEVFGKKRHDINSMIALSMALMFAITGWAVRATQNFLPWVGLLAIVIISFLMLTAMFWPKLSDLQSNKAIKYGGVITVLIIFILVILYYTGLLNTLFSTAASASAETVTEAIAVIITLALFIGGIAIVVFSKESSSGGTNE